MSSVVGVVRDVVAATTKVTAFVIDGPSDL